MAQRFSTLTCPNCNCYESSFFVHNEAENSFLCNMCGALNFLEEPEDENVATYAACYQSGMDNLRALRFSAAMEDFREAYELIPSRPDALWGMICAEYGIVQVRGYYEKKYKAIYCRFAYHDAVPFGQNEYVAELKRLLRNETRLAAVYNKRLADAEMQIRNIREATPKTDAWKWDVFIACKISKATEKFPEAQGRTPEHEEALKLYNDLTARGLRVFYSEKYFASNMGKPENDWQIMAALLNSRQMLLVCGGPNNREKLSTPWVRSEWERWRCMQEHKLKTDDSLLVYNIGDRYPSFPDGLKVTGNVIQASARNDLLTQLQRNCFTEESYRREMSEGSNLMLQGKFDRAVKVFAKLSMLCPERAEPEVQLFLCECRTAMLSELELSRIPGDPYDNEHYRKAQERSYRKTSRACVDLDNRIRALREHEKNRELELLKRRIAELENNNKQDRPENRPVTTPVSVVDSSPEADKPETEFERLLREAKGGDEVAQYKLGRCYRDGTGTSVDYNEAFKWFKTAAEKGYARAQCSLGYAYSYGKGTEVNKAEAFKWYKSAAELGDLNAQNNLGCCYHDGAGTSVDYNEAFKWYKSAAELGNLSAQYSLGCCYRVGTGTSVDYNEAFKWFKTAAEKGHAGAQCNLGYAYSYGKGTAVNKSEAFKWYKSAAELGDLNAQNNLGCCYRDGTGTSVDYNEAFKWFKTAAEKGHAGAQCNLAFAYSHGEGTAVNKAEAFKWYKSAAELGDLDAQFNLGLNYRDGIGTSVDYNEAFKWFKTAAEKGHAGAQCSLGYAYDFGQGTDVNEAEAFKWYKSAAELGNVTAQYNLGLCYEYGRGTTKNLTKAKEWYQKAADNGDKDAKVKLKKL